MAFRMIVEHLPLRVVRKRSHSNVIRKTQNDRVSTPCTGRKTVVIEVNEACKGVERGTNGSRTETAVPSHGPFMRSFFLHVLYVIHQFLLI